ncbi:HPr kinase/phosphorylase, partial [Campylobacter jejuni]|uniref:HPr kinase/phosphorylase n=1 Tax=Campylobacter jejuni TaxID=197 RepID=UPI001BFDFDFD
MDGAVDHLHATAISVGGRAILIRGSSGSGKSDLAFRCLAVPVSQLNQAPARLVSDDQVLLRRQGLSLIASAPATLFGKIE